MCVSCPCPLGSRRKFSFRHVARTKCRSACPLRPGPVLSGQSNAQVQAYGDLTAVSTAPSWTCPPVSAALLHAAGTQSACSVWKLRHQHALQRPRSLSWSPRSPGPSPWCPAAGGGASGRQAPPPSRCHGSRREGADLGTPPPARRLRALSAGAPAGSPVPVTGFETSSATRERAPDRNAGRQGQRGPALRLRRGA